MPVRGVAEIELQRVRAGLQMDHVLALRLAVMLVRRIVRNRCGEWRQFLRVDQEMVMTRIRRCIAGGLQRARGATVLRPATGAVARDRARLSDALAGRHRGKKISGAVQRAVTGMTTLTSCPVLPP